MEPDTLEIIAAIIGIILIIIFSVMWITKSDDKKQKCYKNNGVVVEDWFGLYDSCILKNEK